MKIIFTVLMLMTLLVGCASGSYEQTIVYTRHEQDYRWDARYGLYYYINNSGRRYYMPRGWNYRLHKVPHSVTIY